LDDNPAMLKDSFVPFSKFLSRLQILLKITTSCYGTPFHFHFSFVCKYLSPFVTQILIWRKTKLVILMLLVNNTVS
jgi:hypothetical protein